jgi:hypothetical protein
MIRILTDRIIEGNKRYIEAAGLSTDSKPTANIVTGSVLVSVDDGKGYLFNETAGEWVVQ